MIDGSTYFILLLLFVNFITIQWFLPLLFVSNQAVVVPLSVKKIATTQSNRNSKESTTMKHESVERRRESQGEYSGANVDDDDIVGDMLKDFMQRRVLIQSMKRRK